MAKDARPQTGFWPRQWVADQIEKERHSARCSKCEGPMSKALAMLGQGSHPCCDPDDVATDVELAEGRRLMAAHQVAS